MDENMEIVPFTKKKLREAIQENMFWDTNTIPFPKSKAEWLISNSRIAENDCIGLFAFENKKMVAFLYIIPDILNLNNEKVYWFNVWWVNGKYVKTVLGTYMFQEALSLTNRKVIIKSYAENVNTFYEKQPFDVILSRERYTILFSLSSEILIGRFSKLKKINFLLKPIEKISYSFLSFLNNKKSKKSTKELTFQYMSEIDNETWHFIEPLCKNDLILKTKEYVNWQLDNNQYTTNYKATEQYSLTTGRGGDIYLKNIKIVKSEKIIGFISYVKNSKEINMKYFITDTNENFELCIDTLIQHIINEKAEFVYTDDSKLTKSIQNRYKTVYTYKKLKKGLAHKQLGYDIKNLNLYNRDGHFY